MSFAHFGNLQALEQLYELWSKEPMSVDPSWRFFFEGMEFGSRLPALPGIDPKEAYRTYGHLKARFNPLQTESPGPLPEPLKESQDENLEKIYCGTIGFEYMGLGKELESFIQSQIEPHFARPLPAEKRIKILEQLMQAEGFETFLHMKYVGQKRFSLEGTETLIPMLHAILEAGGEEGMSDLVLGMSHRGRLNVLANILGKSYGYIFEEFEDYYDPDLSEGTGDVKYHKGFTSTYATEKGGKIQIILCANPSHLEAVDPVVEGGARALQESKKAKEKRKEILALLIHGDAAVTGQGVVYETLGLSKLNGYRTCGTIHIVINNQIGYTTLPKDGRSTLYCTDIAKAFGAPVFHVNAEDPVGCVQVAYLSLLIRQRFGCDVFIDLNGYRKYGHNESDEPFFTQPLQYAQIRSKRSIKELFKEQLIQEKVIDSSRASSLEESFKQTLTKELSGAQEKKPQRAPPKPPIAPQIVQTAVELSSLRRLAQVSLTIPEGFNLSPKIARLLKERLEMLETGLDWAMGELLSYATLCDQGVHVRLSGQDVRRGTFAHRHALWVDQNTSSHYYPLSHLRDGQAPCDIFNSSLSETAALGFEFGYSLLYPGALVLWEAQFGDFNNSAQVMIDQFIATSWTKWGLQTSLTLLLPHGYEGQGPEHSSARIERFLQLCAEENMTIANCTTPAQLFHLLRRQALAQKKRPLVLFTPKALLRHPLCKSPLSAFTEGSFEPILDDPSPVSPSQLIFCSGKIFYDLMKLREEKKLQMKLIRIEQLYPLDEEKIKKLLAQYKEAGELIWAQEEPANMGAASWIKPQLERISGKSVRYVGRIASASPATGSHACHVREQETIVQNLMSGKS